MLIAIFSHLLAIFAIIIAVLGGKSPERIGAVTIFFMILISDTRFIFNYVEFATVRLHFTIWRYRRVIRIFSRWHFLQKDMAVMGSSSAIAQRRSAFRKGSRNSRTPNRLRVDEEWSNMGRFSSFDCWHDHQSSTTIQSKQSKLLRQLIGERQVDSAFIATRLLSAFGSIGGVLSASPDALASLVEDQTIVDRLLAAKPAVLEGLAERVQRVSFDLRDLALQQWIVGLFKGYRRERIHLALLDRGKRIIFDEPLSDGDLGKVDGSLRQIVRSGIGIDASGVVLMHNHPSGDVKPSVADVDETRRIAYILSSLDMHLEDHLIVGEGKIFSMKGAKLI